MPCAFMKRTQMLQPHQAILLDEAVEIDHNIAAHVHPLPCDGVVNDGIEIDFRIPIPPCSIIVIIAKKHAVVLKALATP